MASTNAFILVDSDDDDDGISFIGSRGGPSIKPTPIIVDSDSEDDGSDLLLSALQAARSGVSLFEGIVDDDEEITYTRPKPLNTVRGPTRTNSIDNISRATSPKRTSPKRKRAVEDNAAKELEKQAKLLRKAEEKVAKEAARSFQKKLADANRLRTSKNDTVREIHMYMSEDLRLPSSAIAASLPEIEARFKESLSAITYLSVDELPVPGIIRFKRNHTAKWDSKRKAFIPLDKPYWNWERTTLIVLAAGDLVDKLSQGGRHLIDWVKDTRLILGVAQDEPIGILIQGLGKMLAQRRAAANRQYTAAARAGLSSDATSRLDTSLRPDMDKDAIDAELVKLQVAERVFIVHLEKTEEIEDWIWNLAADVAIRPYKLASKSHLSFAPTDHPKKAVSITNALELMLQEVQGVTQSAAAGIAAQYPTFADLMEAFERAERSGGVAEGQSLLEDCEVRNLRNGTANGRRLNKALARRVYNIFRGEDSLVLA